MSASPTHSPYPIIVLKQGYTRHALEDLHDVSVIAELGNDRVEITEIDQVITAYRYIARTGLFHQEVVLAEGPKNPSRTRS
jgi:hypothetical protein